MGQLYERYMQLSVDGRTITTLAGNPDDALRVRFQVSQGTTQTPRIAEIVVSNLSDTSASSLLTAKSVQLLAGYVDNYGLVFEGDVKQVRKGRESPTDTVVRISASHAEGAYNQSVVNKTLKAGSTNQDHYDALLEAMKPFGISAGYTPSSLSETRYPRGVALYGATKDLLRTLAQSVGATWNITNNQLNIVPVNDTKPGSVVVLNSSTGLIGMPEQTFDGIVARSLINTAIDIDRQVQINQSSINLAALPMDQFGQTTENPKNTSLPPVTADGVYKVLYVDYIGDTRGNPWYMDLRCLATSQETEGPPSGSVMVSPYYTGKG